MPRTGSTGVFNRYQKALALCSVMILSACRNAGEGGPSGRPRGNFTVTTTFPSTQSSTQTIHPRSADYADARRRMVADQLAQRGIRDPRVLAAMRDVPRHWFVPESQVHYAYEDRPLSIGWDQTISQPYIVALMTELLAVRPGEKVLEIGTGSGYQAAVLNELTNRVYTIEIVEPLARRTISTLQRRGYGGIHVRIGDGFRGWPEEAPFDAIIVTCAPNEPPPALVEQLKVGGRMCIPVGATAWSQDLVLMTKRPDGTLARKLVAPVAFVPMTGEGQRH